MPEKKEVNNSPIKTNPNKSSSPSSDSQKNNKRQREGPTIVPTNRKKRKTTRKPTFKQSPFVIPDIPQDLLDELLGITKEELDEPKEVEIEKKRKVYEGDFKVNTINDFIKLGELYDKEDYTHVYNISLKIVSKVSKPLKKLQELVGMKDVKESICDQIIYFLLGFNNKTESVCKWGGEEKINNDMLHTVISGPPGCGKTELGKILGEIYKEMGILSNGKLHIKKRADLVGKYLGHTAPKTQKAIDDASGGVLFIDEAYSLGHKAGRDSFSKECLDVLNMNLSERRDFLCIIAGYKDSLNDEFFAMNPGLKRRFSFWYNINGYDSEELRDIFLLKLDKTEWSFEGQIEEDVEEQDRLMEILSDFFEKNYKYFPHFGGDVETFVMKCKISHSRRVLTQSTKIHKILTMEDINNGLRPMKN